MIDFEKPNWADWYMTLALVVSTRSPDKSTKHGCVFTTQSNEPIIFGYNAFPPDSEDNTFPLTRPDKYEYVNHAEENAINMAAKLGKTLNNSILYVTGMPCHNCFRKLLTVGVKEIIYGPINSHCVGDKEIDIINRLNKSKKTGLEKIKITQNKMNDYYKDYIEILINTIKYIEYKCANEL